MNRFNRPQRTTLSSPQRNARGEQKIELDWRAYFIKFCEVHNEPVRYKDVLLFRDGWTYSSTNYQGPETPPPDDFFELDRLVLQYWTIRRADLDRMLSELTHRIKLFKDAIASKSLPLQQIVMVEDEGGARRRSSAPLNIKGLEQRAEWIREDLRECDERLRELEVRFQQHPKSTTNEDHQPEGSGGVPTENGTGHS